MYHVGFNVTSSGSCIARGCVYMVNVEVHRNIGCHEALLYKDDSLCFGIYLPCYLHRCLLLVHTGHLIEAFDLVVSVSIRGSLRKPP